MASNIDFGNAPAAPPSGAVSSSALLAQDAIIQQQHPTWPTGGTNAQLSQETSGYNNSAVSPTGAMGIAQVEPSTLQAIEKQTGRKLDPNSVLDQLFIHRYLINQNMQRYNGDPNASVAAYNSGTDPSKWGNNETSNYVRNFARETGSTDIVNSPGALAPIVGQQGQQQATPTQPSIDFGPSQPSKSPTIDFGGNQPATGLGANLKGLGLQAANLAAGGVEAVPIVGAAAIGFGRRLIEGQGVSDALNNTTQQMMQNFSTFSPENLANKLGISTQQLHDTPGYSIPEKAMNYVMSVPGKIAPLVAQGIANQTGYDKPITPQDVKDVTNMLTMTMVAAPIAGHGELKPGVGVKASGAVSELDKMGNLDQVQPIPEMGPNAGPQIPGAEPALGGQPNAGPARPPISVNTQGLATNPLDTPEQRLAAETSQAGLEAGIAQNATRNPAAPYYTDEEGNTFPATLMNPETTMVADQYGNVGTPSAMEAVRPFRDAAQQRMDALNRMSPEQLSMFDSIDQRPFDQFGENEVPRTLNQDEFNETVSNLAAKDGTHFPLPEDMEDAYNKYLNTVRDDQGGLFDRVSIAKNFVDEARQEAFDRTVADHPIVKANQARVDALEALVAGQDRVAPGVQRNLDEARSTLEKSQKNIGKTLGADKDPTLPYEKDGVVHMYTFGNLPEMFRSIKAVLQGIHGVVFRTLDRLIPNQRNLDSFASIKLQGMKDFVNRQATKDWEQRTNENATAQLKKIPGGNSYTPYEAQEISPAELKAQMQQAPDLSPNKVTRFVKANFLTGQQMAAYTRNPLVKYATETVDRAMRNAAQFVRQQLTGKGGLRDMARSMTDDERAGIWSLMQMNEGVKEFTDAQLKGAGYSDKQVAFYRKRAELNAQKLKALNAGRAEAGLAPVDARIAHIAGHFLGDFKRLITDKDGKVVAVVAHNIRSAVDTISKRVLEQLPKGEYTLGDIQMRKLSEGGDVDRYTGYMNILNDFASRDPVVDKVVQAYRDYMSNDAQAAMKYRAAFKSKEGVIGAEGRKSWQSAKENAEEGIKNELKSMEAMNTWSEMQQALSKIKQFTADPEIDAPNAKALTQNYLDNVQHRNQGAVQAGVNSIVNGVSELTGVGPSVLKNYTAMGKTGLLTMFIGLGKLSHSFVTLIQPLQGIPVVNSLMKAEGNRLGLTQLTAVLKSFESQGKILNALAKRGDVTDPFLKRALQFAKDNDTLNTSQFQFGNLTDINRSRLSANLHKIAEFNVTGMETATRAFTYMYYSHMLRDLGMPEKEIFPTAHNAMRDVMIDYNSWERPGAFGKLGFLGDLTAMLTRYKFNQIDQFARASKFASQGKVAPMATILATSIAAAGVRGIMAYTLANAAVQGITTWAAENNLMQKPTSLDEILLHALHGKNENLSNAVKFGLPSGLGLNLTGSLSHADDIPNDPLGSLVPQSAPIMDMGKAIYNFARDPNAATAKTAAYNLAPNSAKGILENQMFTKPGGQYTNPNNYELQTVRSPSDQTKRAFGFRPLNEANESLTTQIGRVQAENEGAVKQDITQRILRDIDSHGNNVTPTLAQEIQSKYAPKYLANNGDPTELAKSIVEHMGIGQARTAAQRAQGIPGNNLESVLNYLRYQNLK